MATALHRPPTGRIPRLHGAQSASCKKDCACDKAIGTAKVRRSRRPVALRIGCPLDGSSRFRFSRKKT